MIIKINKKMINEEIIKIIKEIIVIIKAMGNKIC